MTDLPSLAISLIPQVSEKDLSTIQSTCIAALTSLLSPTTSRPAGPLSERDRPLAAALMELLETTYDLESVGPSPAYEEIAGPSASYPHIGSDPENTRVAGDSLTALVQELENVQNGSAIQGNERRAGNIQPAIGVYRQEVAMERLQTLSRVVMGIMREREADTQDASPVPRNEPTMLAAESIERRRPEPTPEYQVGQRESTDLPGYVETTKVDDVKDSKQVEVGPSSPSRSRVTSEKMLHDFDNLTTAIERLSSLAPQYSDQRSILRPVRTRSNTPPAVSEAGINKGKGKAEKRMSDKAMKKELENIWSQIERTHGKKRMRDDQRVDMDGVQGRRAEERGQFLQELYERAEISRMRGQDGEMGVVDGDLARARELRDVSLLYCLCARAKLIAR